MLLLMQAMAFMVAASSSPKCPVHTFESLCARLPGAPTYFPLIHGGIEIFLTLVPQRSLVIFLLPSPKHIYEVIHICEQHTLDQKGLPRGTVSPSKELDPSHHISCLKRNLKCWIVGKIHNVFMNAALLVQHFESFLLKHGLVNVGEDELEL
jgi:hypothetical protein